MREQLVRWHLVDNVFQYAVIEHVYSYLVFRFDIHLVLLNQKDHHILAPILSRVVKGSLPNILYQ